MKTVNTVHDQEKTSPKESIQNISQKSIGNLVEASTYVPSEVVQGLLQGFSANSIGEILKLLIEEILSWGRYSEKYEDRSIKLISENKNLKDKTARTQIYNEMKPYLTGISDEYLRKITSKARKILKLFGWEYDTITQEKVNGIGWHMVKQVTYSADTISRLTNIEIRYIIDQVTSV
ncbi:9830_t:CDS:2 [Acaulospora colombiana]|uniref:9830_t:CDS:1 n=1 Tax=Acaulospora colombiana TaxID=27376 RepID=A0ACA9K2D4_9GLOM|nr:9830_t:CDS:2 [Acaulospora colombiana]